MDKANTRTTTLELRRTPFTGCVWKKSMGDGPRKKRSREEQLILQDHHPLSSRTVHPDKCGFAILVQHRHTKMVIG